MSQRTLRRQESSWFVSLATVSLAAFAVTCLREWHHHSHSQSNSSGTVAATDDGGSGLLGSIPSSPIIDESSVFAFSRLVVAPEGAEPPDPRRHRQLLLQSSSSNIDDDITRDDVCREYLTNFLNGTTDAKDTCQAMYKAYQVAECQNYNNHHHNMLASKKNSTQPNNSTNDDDVLIDDAFEKFECCSSISDYYGKHCEHKSPLDAYKLLGIVLVLIICGGTKSLLKIANIQWIPDAGACIGVGALVGGLLRLMQTNLGDKLLAFNNDLFLQIMLPPIVFDAALGLEKRAFRRDLFPILTFAVVGTFLSAVGIAWITYHLSNWRGSGGLPWLDSLLFGSLMSSIDPVATLGILSSVGVSQGDTLYTLVFGESLLNDGVSIVLFDSLVRHMGDADVVDHATIRDTLGHFGLVAIVSIATGALCGALATFYFYALQGKQKAVSEVALFFAWALVPYYVADGLGHSGIIAIMVMGFMMDFYVIGGHQSDEGEWMEYMERRSIGDAALHPVEPYFDRVKTLCCKAFSGRGLILSRSQHHVGFVASVLSSIMETSIFSYLGLFLFNDRVWDVGMTVSGLLACVTSRAGVVILLSLIINACVWIDVEGLLCRLWRYCRRTPSPGGDEESDSSDARVYLDCRTQMILFSAGVRGAVSYALVQNIPVYDAVTKQGSHFKGELRSMTSAAIVILLFSFGALTYFTVQRGQRSDREREAGPLTHRLLSDSLVSEEGDSDDAAESDMNSSFEIEGRPTRRRDREIVRH